MFGKDQVRSLCKTLLLLLPSCDVGPVEECLSARSVVHSQDLTRLIGCRRLAAAQDTAWSVCLLGQETDWDQNPTLSSLSPVSKEKAETLGGVGQVNLSFEAGGERAGHLQADRLCGLDLGVGPQCRHDLTHLNFVYCAVFVHCCWRKMLA